jgi:hypothetical protein
MAVNFKPAPPIRNKKHLNFIRSLPCILCGCNSQAHHLLRVPEKCMGRKSSDSNTIPLCPQHHRQLHDDGDEERFLAPLNGPDLAEKLWQATGYSERATMIISHARTGGSA